MKNCRNGTDATYDPELRSTWSNEQKQLDEAAWFGLVDGDLEPLVAYLESPHPVPRRMRQDIVRCIRGDGTLHQIVTQNVGGRTGRKSVRREIDIFATDIAIAQFVDALVSDDAGCDAPPPLLAKAAESLAVELFGLSRKRIQDARRNYRESTGPSLCLSGWSRYQQQKSGG